MIEREAPTAPDLAELVEEWLTLKRAGRRAGDPGNSDRARRADLQRWAAAIATVTGHQFPEPGAAVSPWNIVTTNDLNMETLVRALALLGDEGLADSTRQRLLTHLRGWCRWLTARSHLDHDPTAGDELRIASSGRDLDARSFSSDDVAALVAAAAISPPPRVSSRWPARDVALVEVLAGCGVRVSELCALTVGSVDGTGELALLRIRRGAKGGGRRDVPIPRGAVAAVDSWLDARSIRFKARPRSGDALFVRTDGQALTQQSVDKLLRMIGADAGVTPPVGAMAHALRHHYGLQLAMRGVPVLVIQQLLGHADPRTTSIYTWATGLDLTHALLDAGWL